MSSPVGGSWSSAALMERIRRDGRIFQAFRSAAASTAEEDRGVRAAPPCRGPSEDVTMPPAASRGSGTGAGGFGSDGLGAETALSILVDCFGH